MTQHEAHGDHGAFWQAFLPPDADLPDGAGGPWQDRFAARMPDGARLMLPLRDLGAEAVAGLIGNQASFTVLDRLVGWMAARVAPWAPDIVVGLPTLGHVFGQGVARAMGHANWVAPGTTRKLWYDPALSVPTTSITAPDAGRRMWLDPRLLPRLRDRRILLVDDVISTGTSARAGLALLAAAEIRPVAVCVAMTQGNRWQTDWPEDLPVLDAFATPLFHRAPGGWAIRPDTWPRRETAA